MDDVKRADFDEPGSILDEEDEATLAAIDHGIQAAEEGRVVSSKEVREWIKGQFKKSS
ncbi:MAG TPA: hypothetical protein VGV35_02280 [Bryobacteraceae bacterium]|nr:hypothetical protein [Bryobacteraceae bacterium]